MQNQENGENHRTSARNQQPSFALIKMTGHFKSSDLAAKMQVFSSTRSLKGQIIGSVGVANLE